jgi:hypothetical protein
MHYYIAIHDAGRSALIAGPYASEHEAQSRMEHVRQLAYDADPWSWFYTFSLARSETCRRTRFGAVSPEITAGVDAPPRAMSPSAPDP